MHKKRGAGWRLRQGYPSKARQPGGLRRSPLPEATLDGIPDRITVIDARVSQEKKAGVVLSRAIGPGDPAPTLYPSRTTL